MTRHRPTAPFCWLHRRDLQNLRDAFDSHPGLTAALAVFLALHEFASEEGAGVFQRRHRQIAERSGVSPRTVAEVLKRLKSAGLLDWEQTTGDGDHPLGPNTYRLPSAPIADPYAGTVAGPTCRVVHRTQKNSEEPRKGATRPWFDAASLEIPEPLRTAAFNAAWQEWTGVRLKGRKPPAGWANLFSKQLAFLEGLGPAVAVACIEASLRNGWTGLFAPRNTAPPTGNGTPARDPYANLPTL